MHGPAVNDLLQHAVLSDQVAHHDKPSSLSPETSEERLFDPLGHLAYPGLAAAHLVIVKVIHHYVVGPHLPETQSSRRLSPSPAEKGTPVLRHKLPFLPASGIVLFAEILDDVPVGLQLHLQVPQKGVRIVLAFPDQHHHMQLAVEFQPQGYPDVKVHGLGMAARPFEHGAAVVVIVHIPGRIVLEPGIGTFAVVSEVTLAEIVVIPERPRDVAFPLLGGFHAVLRCDPGQPFALLQPAFVRVLPFLFRHGFFVKKGVRKSSCRPWSIATTLSGSSG